MCNHTNNRENGRQWTKNSNPISSTGEGLKHEHVYYRPAYILKHGIRFMLQTSRNTWRALWRLSDQPLHQDSVCSGTHTISSQKYTDVFANYLEAKVWRGCLLKYFICLVHTIPSLSSLQSLIRMKLTIMTTATASGRIAVLLNVYHRKPPVLVSIVTREASSI